MSLTMIRDEQEADLARKLLPPKSAVEARLRYVNAEAGVLKRLLKLIEELPDGPPPPRVQNPSAAK